MNGRRRWLLVAVVALVVAGLIAFARGRESRRGDELGASGVPVPTSVSA